MEITVYQAPIQGFTDFVYRKVFYEIFREPDSFFIPYILLKNGELPKKYISEILPENNPQEKVIPQVLAANCEELLIQSEILKNYGYTEINLNLGCPYPMVTNRKRGSGLLPFPGEILKMLDGFFSKSNLKLSVKLRTGLTDPEEIKQIIPVLNEFPLSEVILHPRIARQLYERRHFR
jgi:tRNA-dihydrouridine synthase B